MASSKTKKKISHKAAKPKQAKPIGKVTHYYAAIKVAIVKFSKDTKPGASVTFKGATTDFSQKISQIQYDHKPVKVAKKGKEVGVKVKDRVREGDKVFEKV